jgi:hypothetical protein
MNVDTGVSARGNNAKRAEMPDAQMGKPSIARFSSTPGRQSWVAHLAIRSVCLNNPTMSTRFVTLPELRGHRKPSKADCGNHDHGKFPGFADA